MRRTFVLQVGPDTDMGQGNLSGWIEEVRTGKELRFRSTDELLRFLRRLVEAASDTPSPFDATAESPTSTAKSKEHDT